MGLRLPGVLILAKHILCRPALTASRAASTSLDVPRGFFAVYVGENQKQRFVVPVSYLNQPSFQDLLTHAEEEYGFNHPAGGLTIPCRIFHSALVDVAGHAGKLDAAFEILQKARDEGIHFGIVPYSSLMGACCNAKNWQKALELYEDLKSMKLKQAVSTVNALITALCDGDQLQKALEILFGMKGLGLSPNCIPYSVLLVASEKKDNAEAGLMLLSQAKKDGISPNLVMCRCIIGEFVGFAISGAMLISLN